MSRSIKTKIPGKTSRKGGVYDVEGGSPKVELKDNTTFTQRAFLKGGRKGYKNKTKPHKLCKTSPDRTGSKQTVVLTGPIPELRISLKRGGKSQGVKKKTGRNLGLKRRKRENGRKCNGGFAKKVRAGSRDSS